MVIGWQASACRQKTKRIRTAYCPVTWTRIIVTDETGKFGPLGTDVSHLEEEVFGQLTLDVQVPLLDVRPPVVPVSAVRGRRRDAPEVNAWKNVAVPACGVVSVKSVKCLRNCVRPVAPELAPFPGHQSRVEHPIATSDGGAVVEAVGKSKAGGEVVPVGVGNFPAGIGRQAENIVVAGPDESEVSVRGLPVVKTGIVPRGGVKAELEPLAIFVPYPEVQGELGCKLDIVLNIVVVIQGHCVESRVSDDAVRMAWNTQQVTGQPVTSSPPVLGVGSGVGPKGPIGELTVMEHSCPLELGADVEGMTPPGLHHVPDNLMICVGAVVEDEHACAAESL